MEISEFVKALRILAPSVFGLAILWGSAKLMTGDELMREEGKNIIKNAILGLFWLYFPLAYQNCFQVLRLAQ